MELVSQLFGMRAQGETEAAEGAAARVQAALEGKYHANPGMGVLHDVATTSALNPFASDVVKVIVPCVILANLGFRGR